MDDTRVKLFDTKDDAQAAMYYVKLWKDDRVIGMTDDIERARREARGQGHTGEDWPNTTWYPPVAYVANGAGECVYNPRFHKQTA